MPYEKSVSVRPVHGNPRTGLEPDWVLRIRGFEKGVGYQQRPKYSKECPRGIVFSYSQGGIEKGGRKKA